MEQRIGNAERERAELFGFAFMDGTDVDVPGGRPGARLARVRSFGRMGGVAVTMRPERRRHRGPPTLGR